MGRCRRKVLSLTTLRPHLDSFRNVSWKLFYSDCSGVSVRVWGSAPLAPSPCNIQDRQTDSHTDNCSILLSASFEDKRKENYDKGQAELERRRKELADMQRKEKEEQERKERVEADKREKARLEAERKKQEEIEREQHRQREVEQEREELRKRELEKKEQARK